MTGTLIKDLSGKIIDTFHFEKMIIHDVAVTNDQTRMVCVATLTASPTGLRPSMSRDEKQIIGKAFLIFSSAELTLIPSASVQP